MRKFNNWFYEHVVGLDFPLKKPKPRESHAAGARLPDIVIRPSHIDPGRALGGHPAASACVQFRAARDYADRRRRGRNVSGALRYRNLGALRTHPYTESH